MKCPETKTDCSMSACLHSCAMRGEPLRKVTEVVGRWVKAEMILSESASGVRRVRVARYADGSVGIFTQALEGERWVNLDATSFDPEEAESLRRFLDDSGRGE